MAQSRQAEWRRKRSERGDVRVELFVPETVADELNALTRNGRFRSRAEAALAVLKGEATLTVAG